MSERTGTRAAAAVTGLPAEVTTADQRRSYIGAFGGWALDGFDQSIFGLVLAPAMTELLPASGYPVDTGTIGYFGQLNVAIFLMGWGCSFVWGPVADRTGRVPALMYSILVYAVFSFAAGLSQTVWQLAACRFIAAIGIGGEWAMAGTLVAEVMPERVRARYGGLLHAGLYMGLLLGAIVNYFFGLRFGWRWMFFLGLLPAFFVLYIRRYTKEPERWRKVEKTVVRRGYWDFVTILLRPPYRNRTIVNVVIIFIGLTGFWAGSQYLGATVVALAIQGGTPRPEALTLATLTLGVLSLFTVIGCLAAPFIADRIGRRAAMAICFLLMMVGIAGAYGWAYYTGSVANFIAFVPVIGLGGADFAIFTIWLPEQYGTDVRATAFAFCTTMSRFLAAGGTFLIGWGIAAAHTNGLPLALTAAPFVVGLLLLPLAPETAGQPLPD